MIHIILRGCLENNVREPGSQVVPFKLVPEVIVCEACSEVKSHLGSHLLTPVMRLYTQHTNRNHGVASSSTMGEVTDVTVNKTYN
jgi:hypothetical protein